VGLGVDDLRVRGHPQPGNSGQRRPRGRRDSGRDHDALSVALGRSGDRPVAKSPDLAARIRVIRLAESQAFGDRDLDPRGTSGGRPGVSFLKVRTLVSTVDNSCPLGAAGCSVGNEPTLNDYPVALVDWDVARRDV